MTRNCGNCAWLAGTRLLISRGEPTENATVEIFDKTHGLRFLQVSDLSFLICAQKHNHTARMYGGLKTLKHNVRTTLRFAYHGCKRLTYTRKTRRVKLTQMVVTLRCTICGFATFLDCKGSNATKPSRERMWGSNQNRRQKVFSRGHYICAGVLTFWKFVKILLQNIPKYKLGGGPVLDLACQGGRRFAPLVPVNYATYQMHFKHEQPQVPLPDSLVTIRTIQQMQDAASVLCVYRQSSRHAAWPTVILRFVEICWKTLELSPRNLIGWMKLSFMNN